MTVEWDAVDAWHEEGERVFVHPRAPYHRIDTFQTSRRVSVTDDGTVIAESTRAKALHETGPFSRRRLGHADRADLRVGEGHVRDGVEGGRAMRSPRMSATAMRDWYMAMW